MFVMKLLLAMHKGADGKSCTEEDTVGYLNNNVNTVWFWGKGNAILIWDIGGMILIGENYVFQNNPASVPYCPIEIPHGMDCDMSRTFVVRELRVAA
jgi:hypothetical protein